MNSSATRLRSDVTHRWSRAHNHAGLWTVGSPYEFTRPILRCLKKSCVTACRSITHVVNLERHPATLWRRLSLAAYLVHIYLYLPIMTAYDHVLHVKSDEKKMT